MRKPSRACCRATTLSRHVLRHLKVYAGPEHPHEAQVNSNNRRKSAAAMRRKRRSNHGRRRDHIDAPRVGKYYYGTGRRKEAIARVRLYEGTGNILINGRPYLSSSAAPSHHLKIKLPFEVTDSVGKFDTPPRSLAVASAAGPMRWPTARPAPSSPTRSLCAATCARPGF